MKVVRTCVGCGHRDEKRSMHRVVRSDVRLEIDPAHRRDGRGAYLHGTQACLDAFTKRRGGVRSLRWTPPVGERARVAAALIAAVAGVR